MKTVSVIFVAFLSILQASADYFSATSDLVCAQKGWDAGTESFVHFAVCDSYSLCANFCNAYSGCVSFAYIASGVGTKTGSCELYKVPLKNNFVADEGSLYKFYDKACAPGAAQQCNVNGRSNLDPWRQFKASDLRSCSKQCHDAYGDCQSYAYGEGGDCLFFHDTPGGILVPNSSSSYTFYDRTCNLDRLSSTSSKASTTTVSNVTSASTSTKNTSSGFVTSITTTRSASVSVSSSITKTSLTTPSATVCVARATA